MHSQQINFSIEDKIKIFLEEIGENKTLFSGGLCNGNFFMALRAGFVNKTKKHIERINQFNRPDEEIKKLAFMYKIYIKHYKKYVQEENANQQSRKNQEAAVQKKIRQFFSREILKLIDEAKEMYYFIHMVFAAQNAGSQLRILNQQGEIITQKDYENILQLFSSNNQPNLQLVNTFEIAFNFKKHELVYLLKQDNIISDNDVVSIRTTTHVFYVTRENGNLKMLDPYPIIIEPNTPDNLADIIEYRNFKEFNFDSTSMSLAISVYEIASNKKNISRPNRIEIIQMFLSQRKNLDINALNWDGNSAIHIVAKHNHLDTLELLINLGANLEIKNQKNCTPIMIAAQYNCFQVVEKLLTQKVSLSDRSIADNNALNFAVDKNSLPIVTSLVAAGANIDCCGTDGLNALDLTVQLNHLSIFEFLLSKNHFNLERLLCNACMTFNLNAITFLCQININKPIDSDGNTPLHYVIQKFPDLEIIKVFVKHGANSKIHNNFNETPESLDKNNLIRKARSELISASLIYSLNNQNKKRKTENDEFYPAKRVKI